MSWVGIRDLDHFSLLQRPLKLVSHARGTLVIVSTPFSMRTLIEASFPRDESDSCFRISRDFVLQIVQHVVANTSSLVIIIIIIIPGRRQLESWDISDVNRSSYRAHEHRFRLRHLYFYSSCVFPGYVVLAFDELNAPCNCWWRKGGCCDFYAMGNVEIPLEE